MTEEIKKQFFLIYEGTYTQEIDFGIIHMSEDELADAIEEDSESDGDMTDYLNRELGLNIHDFWTHLGCSENNIDKLFFLASAMANELKGETEIVNYLIDIYEKYKEMSDDEKRSLLEEIGAISKNLN